MWHRTWAEYSGFPPYFLFFLQISLAVMEWTWPWMDSCVTLSKVQLLIFLQTSSVILGSLDKQFDCQRRTWLRTTSSLSVKLKWWVMMTMMFSAAKTILVETMSTTRQKKIELKWKTVRVKEWWRDNLYNKPRVWV